MALIEAVDYTINKKASETALKRPQRCDQKEKAKIIFCIRRSSNMGIRDLRGINVSPETEGTFAGRGRHFSTPGG